MLKRREIMERKLRRRASHKEYLTIVDAKNRVFDWLEEISDLWETEDLEDYLRAHMTPASVDYNAHIAEVCVLACGAFYCTSGWYFYMPATADCCDWIRYIKYRSKKKLGVYVIGDTNRGWGEDKYEDLFILR